MNDSESPISIKEHLSALIDDEAGSFEQSRVLDELKSDGNLSKKLASYALIGETMRTGDSQQPSLILGSDFLDSIHEKIAEEDQFDHVLVDDVQVDQVTDSAKSSSVLRPIGGFALAASIGALTFMGLQNSGLLNGTESQPSNNIVNSSAPTAIAATKPTINDVDIVSTPVSSSNQYVNADAKTRTMLKRYLDSHMQYATTSTFVPAVRVIAYTDNQ